MDNLERKEEALNILNRLALEKYEQEDYVSAIIYFERYLKLNPENALINNMVGFLYQKLSKYENIELQIEHFEKAVELDPTHTCAIRNLALTYQLAGRYEDALKSFQRLFEVGPVDDDFMAYACLQIRLKNFEEGWKYYEGRFSKKFGPTEYPKMDKPRWQGEDISDKTLLVQYEQGLGDTIQFCRYIEQLKPLAKKILFRVQNNLVDLMSLNLKDVQVVDMSTSLKELEFDYHIPLMSLIYALNGHVDNIPLAQGYIKADREKVDKYKKEFFANDCLKIGISYNGAHFGNRNRNIPLRYFYPLTKIPNVKIYSFQKNSGAEQLEKMQSDIEIIDLGKTFEDFSDTAAAMENIDLFITSDNGVFNLAAAMGKPTYLLLSKYSEWRWFLDDKATPWYDSVRIFKKNTYEEDWAEVMHRVIQEIKSA